MELIRPFIVKSWPGYQVKFPKYTREINLPYHSMTSERLHEAIITKLPSDNIVTGKGLSVEEAQTMGKVVIDVRGSSSSRNCGFQKFVGLEIETTSPHGLSQPVLMDATVEQIDGFRFIYYLPFSETRLLIEDTRYSDNSFIDHFRMKEQIMNAIKSQGWSVKEIIRTEHGSLPIPFGDVEKEQDIHVIAFKNIFHDTTGYSLPDAMRVIGKIMNSDFTSEELKRTLNQYHHERKDQRKFFRLLNRLMFHASEEHERFRTLEFFYKSSPALISKFYRGDMNLLDKFRFFAGKPPVEMKRAFTVFKETIS